jgi:hypothetical protein
MFGLTFERAAGVLPGALEILELDVDQRIPGQRAEVMRVTLDDLVAVGECLAPFADQEIQRCALCSKPSAKSGLSRTMRLNLASAILQVPGAHSFHALANSLSTSLSPERDQMRPERQLGMLARVSIFIANAWATTAESAILPISPSRSTASRRFCASTWCERAQMPAPGSAPRLRPHRTTARSRTDNTDEHKRYADRNLQVVVRGGREGHDWAGVTNRSLLRSDQARARQELTLLFRLNTVNASSAPAHRKRGQARFIEKGKRGQARLTTQLTRERKWPGSIYGASCRTHSVPTKSSLAPFSSFSCARSDKSSLALF